MDERATSERLSVRPEQPEEVLRALATLLDDGRPAPDPWWRAGNEDALRSSVGAGRGS